jgi:hypothetical protein
MIIYSAKLAHRKTDIHFHNDIVSGAKPEPYSDPIIFSNPDPLMQIIPNGSGRGPARH